jgi:SAM-dependent methyltransferase
MLYPVENVIADERRFYSYYQTMSATNPEGTKWASQIETVTARLRESGLTFDGKDVLDISGGPGFLSKHIAAQGARRTIVTEFSPAAVEGMRKNLGLDAAVFDYQSHDIRDAVDGPFDLVIIDYSINFCLDVNGFAQSLAKVLRPGAFVYVSWVHPTMGCVLRWQFDEYTYNALYGPDILDGAFVNSGLRVRASFADVPYDFRTGLTWKHRLVRDPISLWYRYKAPRGAGSLDDSLMQRHSVRLYELPSDDIGDHTPSSSAVSR